MGIIDTNYNDAITGALGNPKVNKGDAMDKDSFLLLLVTQFKNQDPLNPMEDKEFIAQLAQFSSLEQLMNLNKSMDGLTEVSQQQQMIGAATYIGKEVSARGNTVSKKEDSISKFFYAFEADVAKASINVMDSSNQIIGTINLGAQSTGTKTFEWDGTLNGKTMPDGVYKFTVSGTNAKGEAVLTDTLVTGKVDGVTTVNGVQYLRLTDGRIVGLLDVREVTNAVTVPPTGGEGGGEGEKPTPEPDPGTPEPDPGTPENPKPEKPTPETPAA